MISFSISITIIIILISIIHTKSINFIEKTDDNEQEEALKEYISKKATKGIKGKNKRIY